jgi:hypothetical protein
MCDAALLRLFHGCQHHPRGCGRNRVATRFEPFNNTALLFDLLDTGCDVALCLMECFGQSDSAHFRHLNL